jgi:hypothetical protein
MSPKSDSGLCTRNRALEKIIPEVKESLQQKKRYGKAVRKEEPQKWDWAITNI